VEFKTFCAKPQKRATARRQQAVILHNLSRFASEEHNLQWDDAAAGQAVVGYLTRFSVDCLRTFTQGCALPEVSSTSDTQIFVVSKFVRHIHDYSADLFDAFVNLVKGHMLANALLCEDLESLQKRFKRVTFYLDTPFLLRLLGFWGKSTARSGGGTVGFASAARWKTRRIRTHCGRNSGCYRIL